MMVGCLLFGKYTVLGMYGLDSSVSNVRAQWKGEEEGCIYSVGSMAYHLAYQLVLGSIPAL